MALENESGTGMVMPVTPMGGGYGYGMPYGGGFGGFGGFGGNFDSLIVLFLFAAMFGGFGNGFGGNGGGGAYPWLLASNTDNGVQAGFYQAATAGQLSAIQSSLDAAEVSACNRAMTAMQTAYSNQIADMERSFAAQTANTAALSGISAQLAQCCCDNRQATADLKYTVATEACADRNAVNNALPAGATVTPIAVAIAVNGEPRPTSRAIYTPAAVEEFGNVTSTAIIRVPRGCCFSLSVEAVPASADTTVTPAPVIDVQNANLVIDRIA